MPSSRRLKCRLMRKRIHCRLCSNFSTFCHLFSFSILSISQRILKKWLISMTHRFICSFSQFTLKYFSLSFSNLFFPIVLIWHVFQRLKKLSLDFSNWICCKVSWTCFYFSCLIFNNFLIFFRILFYVSIGCLI